MDNSYQSRILRTFTQRGKQEAIQRGVSILMSYSLGRDFGESCASHDEKHPEIIAFRQWFNTWREQA